MMQFNPLFLNMSQALPELSKPDKFGGVSYLFSDIIKVFLSENDEQSSEDQKVLSAAGDQIKSLIDVFNKTGKEINNENKIETIHGKKLKLSLDEISDSSVQKVFAGIANEVLQAGTEISVKKGSENSIRKIELNSAVPEDDAAKTISLFIEKINENFGMKEIDKAAFNAPQLKATGTIQSPVSPEINQNLNGNNGEISSVAGTNSIKFKLESPGELLTFELTKPEKEPLTNIGNKNLSVFNNFPEPGQRDFKLQVTYSVNSQDEPIQNLTSNFGQINADKIYKEPESLKSIYTGDLKVEPEDKPVIQSADTFVHDETSDPKPGSTENRQVEEDIKPDVPAQGKLFSKESEILKSIYQEQSNIEDESKSIPSNKLINSIEKPQIENDITPAVQLSDKLFNNETENVKSIYDGSLNSGDENKSVPANNLNNKNSTAPNTINQENLITVKDYKPQAIDKKSSPLSINKVNIPNIKNLKNEIKLKIAIEPKEASKNEPKPQHMEIKNDSSITYKPGKDVFDSAPLNAVKGTAFLSLEISKDKEPSDGKAEIKVIPVKENEGNNISIKEENNKSEVNEKNSAGNQNQYSDQLKHDDASGIMKSKIQDPISLNQGKEFSANLNNEQSQIKETIQKGNSPIPSFKSEEAKIINYANLNEEISGIIKEHEVQSVVLKLQPEELGKVKVVLDMINNGIKANIEVSNEAVRQTVQSTIEQLKMNLIQQGIQLSSLNVTLNNYEQKPNKAFDQKKQRYTENSSGNEAGRIENKSSTSKKLGYNTYEYLI